MRAKEIIEVVVERVKAELGKSAGGLESELTPKNTKRVEAVLTQAMAAAWVEGYRTYLRPTTRHDRTDDRGGWADLPLEDGQFQEVLDAGRADGAGVAVGTGRIPMASATFRWTWPGA